jgi:hypothetical protein
MIIILIELTFECCIFRMMEKAKLQKEAEKQRKLEERIRARDKAREEKRRLDEFYKDWNKPREDLTCEDLKVCTILALLNYVQ